jgi:hypothetical protein
VNDVANVNIDAKLIRNDRNRAPNGGIKTTSDLADTVELANGCACKRLLKPPQDSMLISTDMQELIPFGTHELTSSVAPIGCSIQDELFASFEELLGLADKRGSTYDR